MCRFRSFSSRYVNTCSAVCLDAKDPELARKAKEVIRGAKSTAFAQALDPNRPIEDFA